MTEYSYFKDTDFNAWDVVGFYRRWISDYKEDASKLNYQKAKDKLVKCLEDIAASSPTGNEVRKAQTLLRKAKQSRKKGGTIDTIWKSVEIDVFSKEIELEKVKLKHVQISGMVRTAKENQKYASTMNKGVLSDLEGEFAERKKKRSLSETKSSEVNKYEETPKKRLRKQDLVEKAEDFSGKYNGQRLDPELFLVETDKEYDADESNEHPFDYDEWTLKSGLKVIDLLKVAAGINGHLMRPEVWGIVRCGLKVAKPKWCEEEEYVEIQKTIKQRSIIDPPEFVVNLLKNKSLTFLEMELNKIKIKELMKLNDDLEGAKQLSLVIAPPDALTSFFVKILSRFHQFVFPQQSIMQQIGVSEVSYGAYIIHPCLIELLAGLEGQLLYEPGEVTLSSIKSCCERRKCESFEQKADGIFLARLKRSCIEIGHLEISGGYGHREISRSTWDGCCKGPLGNMYMLEEVGERYRKASPKSFANTRVYFVHTYEDKIEIWQMYNRARGILQWERTHKAIVPICYEEQKKYLFDFVVLLWDLKEGLINTVNMVKQLQDEDNDGISKLSGRLPPHPGKPDKEKHKKGINNVEVKSVMSSSPIREDQ
ncbi:hypothetical protein GLOIN_2v1707386 [Rhizophagus clarus]|uniref:Uncharacterized protein n=1 Tax=Rhizophagus clarus TaxID=94130 RepID=A0A8H3LV03_9GLOM|nr:hypothetical protein GLOIN_2v1707386 [Rhizophagus clarus]